MPFAIIWSGWGLGTLGIGVLGFLFPTVVSPDWSRGAGFILAAAANFLFVRALENTSVTRKGATFTRAQESTLFFMPLHYWTWIFAILGVAFLLRLTGAW